MKTKEVIQHYLDEDLDRESLIEAVMAETNTSRKTVQNLLSMMNGKRRRKKEIEGAQTLEEYSKPYDHPQHVLDALETLRSSSKSVCGDVPFRKFCGISTDKWKVLKTLSKLEKYHRKMPNGQTLWGDPDKLSLAEKRARYIYE